MRKPVSKHALRRALEQVNAEGLLDWNDPTGAVVDRIWHMLEKDAFGVRKRAAAREGLRRPEPLEA
jgi:DNA-binding GntR family transcriptional regulator